jgi:elongator complex protein 3
MVRELHVYGQLASLKDSKFQKLDSSVEQHKGFGSQLVAVAEQIASHGGYGRLSIIAGVGVKAYYRRLGYEDVGTYVVKKLSGQKMGG